MGSITQTHSLFLPFIRILCGAALVVCESVVHHTPCRRMGFVAKGVTAAACCTCNTLPPPFIIDYWNIIDGY